MLFSNQKTFSVRFHGFGGEGTKSLAFILAKAAISEGLYAQAFPEFGPERRGAPIKAFARFSHEPIITKSQISQPDFVIIMNSYILNSDEAKQGTKENTHFLINTPKSAREIKKEFSLIPEHHYIHCIDANSWIQEFENKVHLSIPLIGRFIRITELIKLETIKEELRKEFLNKIGEEKIKLTEKALEESYYEV